MTAADGHTDRIQDAIDDLRNAINDLRDEWHRGMTETMALIEAITRQLPK